MPVALEFFDKQRVLAVYGAVVQSRMREDVGLVPVAGLKVHPKANLTAATASNFQPVSCLQQTPLRVVESNVPLRAAEE
jgi:hypothetical protein